MKREITCTRCGATFDSAPPNCTVEYAAFSGVNYTAPDGQLCMLVIAEDKSVLRLINTGKIGGVVPGSIITVRVYACPKCEENRNDSREQG